MELFKRIYDLLFPPKCMFCHVVIGGGHICDKCLKELPECGKLGSGGEFFSKSAAALYYTGNARRAVLAMKFSGKRAYAEGFAQLLAKTVDSELRGEYDIITWVPISAKRLRARGYDQARLLAESTAAILGVSAVPALTKWRDTPAQSTLSDRARRAANVSGAYKIAAPETVRDKRVLLIDDVFTTGATASECARVLLMAGAEDVVLATACAAKKR